MMGISENLLAIVDDEVRRMVDECYAEARRSLRENRHELDSIVQELLARDTLEERESYAAAGIDRPTNPKAAEPVAAH